MRILNIWNFFQPELKYHVHFLSEHFTAEGNEVFFISTDKSNKAWAPFLKNKEFKAGKEIYPYATVYRLKCLEIFNKQIPLNWIRYYRLIKEIQPDVVHILGIGNFLSWICIGLLKIYNKKVVLVANDHSNPNETKEGAVAKIYKKFNQLLFKLYGHQYKCIICPNTASKVFIQNVYKIDEERMKVIPLGYDDTAFYYDPALKNSEKDKLIVSFAGKIEPRKRIEELLYAVSEMKNKLHVIIRIAGLSNTVHQEYFSSLKNIQETCNLTVEFLPLLQQDNLRNFYNFSDIAVFPGSISITTVEANACGIPIILFESIQGLEDRVENGRGKLFKKREELTNYLDEFYIKKIGAEICNLEIEEVTKTYAWGKLSKQYMKLYESFK